MEKRYNVSILSSKRLTQSFKQVDDRNVWQSLGLTKDEATATVKRAINKMDENSPPLTITVTVNE